MLFHFIHSRVIAHLFGQAGGILDPKSQLKLADFTGKGGQEKLLAQMGAASAAPKAKAKAKAANGNTEAQQARMERLVY